LEGLERIIITTMRLDCDKSHKESTTDEFEGNIVWRIDPLLGKDLETHNKTTAVAKHASTTIELLLETVLCTRSAPRNYEEENWGNQCS
jgi:hypothetical protein